MKTALAAFLAARAGATSVEYALIAVLISVAILTAVTGLGQAVNGKFETVQAAVTAAP